MLNHRESTELQYKLVERAAALGWPTDQIQVIDDDMGLSARTAENRAGFQRLLAEVATDHVGLTDERFGMPFLVRPANQAEMVSKQIMAF